MTGMIDHDRAGRPDTLHHVTARDIDLEEHRAAAH